LQEGAERHKTRNTEEAPQDKDGGKTKKNAPPKTNKRQKRKQKDAREKVKLW
jgi:hypothetical protein